MVTEGVKSAYKVSTTEQREEYKSWLKKQKQKIGIYFLYKGNEVVYVGQSVNIENRIQEHRGSKDFDSYNYVLCDRGELNEKEAYYILKHRPSYNVNLPHNKIYKPIDTPHYIYKDRIYVGSG